MPLFSFFKRFSKLFKTVPPVYKLGVSYSVMDGEEMLEFAIRSIRSEVDYVNVVWQKLSWFGTMCSDELEPTLERLKNEGLIDELIFFTPDLKAIPAENEAKKRNMGLKAARKAAVRTLSIWTRTNCLTQTNSKKPKKSYTDFI